MENQRQFIRTEYSSKILITHQGQKIEGTVIDISLHGLFCKIPRNIEKGEELDCTIHLEGGTARIVLNINGVITRSLNDGIGIEFSELDFETFVHLKYIVSYMTGDPKKIMTEFCEYLKNKNTPTNDDSQKTQQ